VVRIDVHGDTDLLDAAFEDSVGDPDDMDIVRVPGDQPHRPDRAALQIINHRFQGPASTAAQRHINP